MIFRTLPWDRVPKDYRAIAALAALCLCAGCAGRNVTADNPVVALVPPRVAVAEADMPGDRRAQDDALSADSDIEQVDFQDGENRPKLDSEMSNVAAVVNGRPILISDVLEPHAQQLAQIQQQVPPDKFVELRNQLIRRELPRHIDETVLMDAALVQLDDDGRAKLDQQLDDFFSQKLKDIQKKLEAGTLAELEAKMQAQGTTLSNLRRAFGRQQLAQQSIQLHMTQQPTVSRPELFAEYEKRIEEYKQPGQAKWQQIVITYSKHGGKQQALAVLDRAIAELRGGTDFADVARKYSDGVMAKDGGHWDWTRKGSVANVEIDRMLFELNVGEIGEVISSDKAFQLVRVTERLPDRVTPFEEVQNDLRTEILAQKQEKLHDEVIKRLRKDAVITTMFDASSD